MRKGERKLLKDSIIQYVKENTAKISLEELDTVLTAEAIAGYFQVKRNTVSYYLNQEIGKTFFKINTRPVRFLDKKVFEKNAKYFNIPGFRKGKAPMNIVEKFYGDEIFYEDAFNEVVPEVYESAIKEEKLDVVSRPDIQVTQIGKGKDLIFTAVVQTKPDVKLGRIQIFNNWSPYMVSNPEKNVWIGLEYFCNEGDEYWNMSDEEFTKFAIKELVSMGVIEESNFQPNSNARQLKRQAASSLSIIVKGNQNMLFADILEKMQMLLSKNGEIAEVSYIDEDANEVECALMLCRERNPKGIIFLGGNLDYFDEFEGIDVPCILVTNSAGSLNISNLCLLYTSPSPRDS